MGMDINSPSRFPLNVPNHLHISSFLIKFKMWHLKEITLFVIFLQMIIFTAAWSQPPHSFCKAIPGLPDWPSASVWSELNETLSGRLIQPPPPGAVCHSDQPTYNAKTCPTIQADWLTAIFHTEDPVSTINNNFNNDTCLPYANDTCSELGYPVYVVNATCADDVKKGVDFARKHNIRLIVKATGHDYLGRCEVDDGAHVLSQRTNLVVDRWLQTPSLSGHIISKGYLSMMGSSPKDVISQLILRR